MAQSVLPQGEVPILKFDSILTDYPGFKSNDTTLLFTDLGRIVCVNVKGFFTKRYSVNHVIEPENIRILCQPRTLELS